LMIENPTGGVVSSSSIVNLQSSIMRFAQPA
jgi:hypothetical protein